MSTTSARFLRPDDLQLVRRNRHQLQSERFLAFAGRLLFVVLVAMAGTWVYQRTQQDQRFAVRSVELAGVKHTSRTELQQVSRGWIGLNLFKLDIARVQGDLGALPWIERVSIEKKLPSVLKIIVVERQPVALASTDGVLRYVDARGKAFAELSPQVGNADLPLITNAGNGQLGECLELLQSLEKNHPALYSRISEITPDGESGFVIFDRDLKTRLLITGEEAAAKWAALYSIAKSEGFRARPAEYIDLRFDDRIIVMNSVLEGR